MTSHMTSHSTRICTRICTLLLLFVTCIYHTGTAYAQSRLEIDTRASSAVERLYEKQAAARELGEKAVGLLVFPRIIKGGVGVGGEFGDGVLMRPSQPNLYYRITSLSVGFQLGGQAKTEILMFMTEDALRKFVESDGWEAGIDGSVAVIEFGVGREIDTNSIRDPIIAFVYDNKGLMYNLSLEGTKFWRINKR